MPSEHEREPGADDSARSSPARLASRRSSAIANMLSDSGASDSPACIALYSSTIWRKIGSAIIVPPSAICCSSCPVTPNRKSFDLNRSGSSSVGLALPLARTSQYTSPAMAAAPSTSSAPTASPPSCQTRMLSTMPPMPTTDRTAPTASTCRSPVYGASRTSLMPDSTIDDDHVLEQERDSPRQVGGDESAEQRSDRRRDRRRRPDQRVRLLLRRAFEVAVDERLHGGKQQRRAEAADDRPEDDDRGEVSARAPSRARRCA